MMRYPRKASTITLMFLIYLHCVAIQVSSLDTLKSGDQLNSSSRLVSADATFTLGFYTPRDTNNTYLAVWLTKGLHGPVWSVWIGNRDKPIPSNSSPVLTIGTRGELIITHDGGEYIELYAGGSAQNAAAILLDTGNFVVKEMNSSEGDDFLWQSFDHPTDTLLPGMKLGVNHRTGRNLTLSSWFEPSDPAPGVFTLEWDPSLHSFLVRRRGVVYWTSGELKYYSDDQSGNLRAEFDNIFLSRDPFNFYFNLTNVASDEEEYVMLSILPIPYSTHDPKKVISGWKLDYQGDIYDINRAGIIARPSVCYGYKTPTGCKGPPSCRNEHQEFVYKSGHFRPDKGQVHEIYDNSSKLSLSDCREICWNDCDCVAYTDGAPGCVYWKGKNLEFVQSLDGSVVRKYVLESASTSKGMKKRVQIILIVVGLTMLLILGAALFILRRLKQDKMEEELQELLKLDGYTDTYELENGGAWNNDLKLFTYASIQSATSNFSPDSKLGEGGFGPVYKGKTPEGQDIAVKLLSRQSGQGLIEFKTELILISKLQHINLVKLLGFCIHGDEKMIIYDYMPNKSLDFFLFSPSEKEQLDWQKRFSIIEGTAQGLLYLHKYSRLRIIHRDLKPSNILLDENMNPKISDFGLARIFKQNDSEDKTNRRLGTYGYMAPEYAMQGKFSLKSDVFSFGVLILEIVSGRRNNSFHQIEGPQNLVEYAWELWREDSAPELIDPTLRNSCFIDQLKRCIHIGLLCVENHAADRPTIEDAISMLKNETATLPIPKSPAFITRNSVVEVEKNTPEKLSTNEVTLTEILGR